MKFKAHWVICGALHVHVDSSDLPCQLLVECSALCTEIFLDRPPYRTPAQQTCLQVEWNRASLISSRISLQTARISRLLGLRRRPLSVLP